MRYNYEEKGLKENQSKNLLFVYIIAVSNNTD